MKGKDYSGEIGKATQPVTEIIGNKQMIIDGCKCVLDYEDSYIELSLGNTGMRITGAQLVMNSFFGEQAVISGVIAVVEFFGL